MHSQRSSYSRNNVAEDTNMAWQVSDTVGELDWSIVHGLQTYTVNISLYMFPVTTLVSMKNVIHGRIWMSHDQ